MSRIRAARGGRVYRRDRLGRFAKTGSGTANKVAKAVGITAITVAGAVAGTAIATGVHHQNTVKIADEYRSSYQAEQAAAEMDRRVEKLIEKHRKRQRIAAGRFR